jgi:tetratricopeptide (TPR) repeat protein
MLTNKKRFREWVQFLLAMVAVAILAGCGEPGPRALLDGKRLLEAGKLEPAIEKLESATTLLHTNAQAFNYLGLACHQSGQTVRAEKAYQQALKLDHDLVIVHYNLGCLLLEEKRRDKLELARNELTAFTLHQGNSADGWLKLGTAQLRLGELGAAEKSFTETLRLSPQNPEALNDLGMVLLQRNRANDAAAYFNAAVKQQPDYAPALLNLAVVSQTYLNNRPLALQKYREYLALKPQPANWEAIDANARQLERELTPPARPNPPLIAANPATNVVKPVVTNPVRTVAAVSNTPVARVEPRTNAPRLAATPVVPSNPVPVPVPAPEPIVKPEVVQLAEGPVVRAAKDVQLSSARPSPPPVVEPPSPGEATPPSQSEPKPPKKKFFQKLNPSNLFHRDAKSSVSESPTPQTQGEADRPVSSNPSTVSTITPRPVPPVSFARYAYKSPSKPVAGNHIEAERYFTQGLQTQRDQHNKEAETLFRKAVATDPGYFDAQFHLGLTASDLGDLALSLQAFEMALAITPDSFNARFYFALALKKASYYQDAAQELEKLLAGTSEESPTRLSAAHLTLANLYADQLRQPQAARAHYSKVVELDPQNSQATAIRYWLRDNP